MASAGSSPAPAGTPKSASLEIVRTFNVKLQKYAVRVLPGVSYTTGASNEIIITVLGSCVAACIRNPHTGFGGMNHFMLPESEGHDWNGVTAALRYGNHAMEALINDVLASGCSRSDLEIKLFGGATLYQGITMVGQKNAEFALSYLKREGLPIVARDLGGEHGRRIHYDPSTGSVQRLLLRDSADRKVAQTECTYKSHLNETPVESGDVELFG
ncbi:chemoreceptor glutamine deamidase CheD [Labrenzia sp. PHM005]|uniref:chemoreceptor glutamine deamidase CheD n=1 Tax=Labrenzia sp. PHM005 TaxID=2590016 RepID=UPI001AD8C4E4|nr:chemoreceptor glutamine deamidase CheD [Labrenzia sp. PHM005]